MLSPRWRKVVRELWSNRARTALVVASIAVGIFAVGTVQHLRTVILSEMQAVYIASNAAHATISAGGISDALLTAIRRMPEVAEAEGRSSLTVKVEVKPGQWQNMSVVAIGDFDDIRIDRIERVFALEGRNDVGAERSAWPGRNELVVERSALDSVTALPAGVRVGDTLRVETRDGRIRDVRLSGIVYAPTGFPATFTGSATAYVTRETFERLGGSRNFSQVVLRVNGTPEQLLDKEYITAVAESVAARMERSGLTVGRIQVPEPGRLILQDLFDALALLLTPLGLLALLLSGFLVINTISALMAQQVRQIGIMKAVGARRGQIIVMYLGAVLIYSVAALALAVPLTLVVAGTLAVFLGGFINIDFPRWALPLNVLGLMVMVGILAPLLAALYPVIKGTAVTVREAVSDYGTNAATVQEGPLTRLLAAVGNLPRPLQLSLRNTFRRRARLALTLLTLILGGMIFMTIGSVRASLDGLIDTGLAYFQFDIQVQFNRPYRTGQLERVAREIPEIDRVESWGAASAIPILADGSEGDPLSMTALMAESAMVQPTLTAGRWLLPEDRNALVVSQRVLASLPDLQVGDVLRLQINGKETPWVVVGIAQVLGGPPNVVPIYANYPYFAWLTNNVDRATSLQVTVKPGSTRTTDEIAAQLNERLTAAGFQVSSVFTIATLRRFTGSFFDIIVYLLLSMGVLIAAVGALGLMGTMSTNVLERTREIGVMRAIGASDGSVQQIVIVEGIFIGWISWLLGALLSFPMGALIAQTVGSILFRTQLPYVFSAQGLVIWFIIVTVLAALASFLPAWNAARLTVREVLAYQ